MFREKLIRRLIDFQRSRSRWRDDRGQRWWRLGQSWEYNVSPRIRSENGKEQTVHPFRWNSSSSSSSSSSSGKIFDLAQSTDLINGMRVSRGNNWGNRMLNWTSVPTCVLSFEYLYSSLLLSRRFCLLAAVTVHKLDSNYAVTCIMVIQPMRRLSPGEIGDNFFFVSWLIKFVKDWEDSLVEMKRICTYTYINNRNWRIPLPISFNRLWYY